MSDQSENPLHGLRWIATGPNTIWFYPDPRVDREPRGKLQQEAGKWRAFRYVSGKAFECPGSPFADKAAAKVTVEEWFK